MGVMSVVKRAGGDSAVRTATAQNTAQVVYDVQTEDSSDTQGVVLEHFRTESDLLYLYDTYEWGDSTDSSLFCKSIAAKRVDSTIWTVTLNFEFPKPEDSDDQGKSSEGDPMRMPNEISVSSSQESVPVREAIYRGGFKGWVDDAALAVGGAETDNEALLGFFEGETRKTMQPCNSRFKPLVPPLEKQEAYTIVTYSTSFREYPSIANNSLNTINKNNVILRAYGQEFYIFEGTGLWKGISGNLKLFHKPMNDGTAAGYSIFFPYWRMTFTFHVKSRGWHQEIIDMGNTRAKSTPDGINEPFSPGRNPAADQSSELPNYAFRTPGWDDAYPERTPEEWAEILGEDPPPPPPGGAGGGGGGVGGGGW